MCLIVAVAAFLGLAFLGCRETLPTEPPIDLSPNLDQLALGHPSGGEPFVIIDTPAPPVPADRVGMLGRVIVFKWHSGLDVEPHFVRWLCMQVVDTMGHYNPAFDIVRDLNQHPSRYESRWLKWVPYKNPHGRTATVGVDDTLALTRSYIFAVQAKDHSGKVTTVFNRGKNVRQFVVSSTAVPLLTITEPFAGTKMFIGMNLRAQGISFPTGLEMNFSWRADASNYGGQVVGYRYGWDVPDINDKNDWEVRFSIEHTSAPPIALQSGVHTLYVEAIDNSGGITLGRIEVSLISFTMERNLLWVDDFPSSNFTQTDYATPTEMEHDAFWLGFCAKATGFDASRDVYDAYYSYNGSPPPLSLITKYKNIIWTYSSSPDAGAWDDVILFTPESMIGTGTTPQLNYLPLFLAKGGHLLTEGRSERSGGLAAALLPFAQVFPMSLKCDITGPSADCSGDQSGVNSMPYRDYCVSVIDKIVGTFRSDPDMPLRTVRNYDCLASARKSNDVVAGTLPGLPDTLALWEEITKPGRYFNPLAPSPYPGGFTLVEVYDPAYWMARDNLTSQPCFHPLYRMKAKNTVSALNNTAMALCLTKYENVVPDVGSGVAAKSFHFGTELWYFNRQQVNKIMDVIFSQWQIGPIQSVLVDPADN
jgi:hypothetical protein